jgi:hypothetical protein
MATELVSRMQAARYFNSSNKYSRLNKVDATLGRGAFDIAGRSQTKAQPFTIPGQDALKHVIRTRRGAGAGWPDAGPDATSSRLRGISGRSDSARNGS